ncbi:CIS tube protein [Micromonospora profundi]|uniref:CIS tube protein n=1 Tax=Micromonospora profundi TaxID=1420889 RepID=UPI0036A7B307
MERVAFLIDSSGERVDCLLNPETVQVTRLAGVRHRGAAGGQLTGSGLADDPLVFTGGGRTELVLDLLFDVDFVQAQVRPPDVRVLTRPLWMLAENSSAEHGWLRPPLVRLVWGKTWNVPGVIIAVAERFDAFTGTGSPRRSWLRLKLVRAAETADQAEAGFAEELAAASTPTAAPGSAVVAAGDGAAEAGSTGVRFDLLANDALGSPLRWRLLAEHNRITDPLAVPAGTTLAVPPPTGGIGDSGTTGGGSTSTDAGGAALAGIARAVAGAVGSGASFVGTSIATSAATWSPTTNPGGTP